MSTHPKPLDQQAGMMLLEGLIAILIFSLGILSVVGLQTVAVKQVTDARYRSEAGLLANQLLGTMWVSDRTMATLKANFDSTVGGAGYTTWKDAVAGTLPGITATTNLPVVDVTATNGVSSPGGTVTITIHWLAPGEPTAAIPHKYVAVAQMCNSILPTTSVPDPVGCL